MLDDKKGRAFCDTCGADIIRSRYRLIQSDRHFCDNVCRFNYKWKPGEKCKPLDDRRSRKEPRPETPAAEVT